MTIEEIRRKVGSPDYDFLRNNQHLGKNIILLGLGGSYAYGTNIETSDLDVRGCALNSKEDILTNQNFEQFVNEETDTTIYSFNKLINLLSNSNPNTIEILGLEPWQYLYISPIGKQFLANKKMFLSKKCIHSFGGYANAQLYRLQHLEAHEMGQTDLEKHILKTLEFMKEDFGSKYSTVPEDSINLYIDKAIQPDMETEIYMDVNLTHYPLRDYTSMWEELRNVTSQYKKIGKRNAKALEHGKIAKHMMHLVRLYLMCFDILEKGEIITYRRDDHDFLMKIRNGAFVTENNQVLPEFYDIVNEYEKRLTYDKDNTDLPEKPNYKEIQEFMMYVNELVVREKI